MAKTRLASIWLQKYVWLQEYVPFGCNQSSSVGVLLVEDDNRGQLWRLKLLNKNL